MKLLAIDIGNTSIQFGLFSGRKLVKSRRLPTAQVRTRAIALIKKEFKPSTLEAAVISSVVPAAGVYLRRAIPASLKVKALLVGKDLKAPIKNRYRVPKQVGMDRLMNAVAFHKKYRRDGIIVDFGTAITFDVVTKKGEYLGGVIAPGIEISIEALFRKTALLPRIRLAHVGPIIGRDTISSIRSGCSYGIGGLCDRIIERIASERHIKPFVVATGGYASFMRRYCRHIRKIEPDLVLQGILETYRSSLS